MSGRGAVALVLAATLLAAPLALPIGMGAAPARAATSAGAGTDGVRETIKSVNRALTAVLLFLKVLEELPRIETGVSPPPAYYGSHPDPLPVVAPVPDEVGEFALAGAP
jgi:hypothetical protein